MRRITYNTGVIVRRVDRPTCWSPPDVCLAGNVPWRDSPRLEAHQMVAVGCHAGMRASLARGPGRTGHVTGFRACIVRCTLGWRVTPQLLLFFFSPLSSFLYVKVERNASDVVFLCITAAVAYTMKGCGRARRLPFFFFLFFPCRDGSKAAAGARLVLVFPSAPRFRSFYFCLEVPIAVRVLLSLTPSSYRARFFKTSWCCASCA